MKNLLIVLALLSTLTLGCFTDHVQCRDIELYTDDGVIPASGNNIKQSPYIYPQILEPIREGGNDVLLVFMSGALILGKRYVSLCETIQTTSDLRLWIAIFEKLENATIPALESSLDDILIKVEKLGFRSKDSTLFIGGHSFGALLGWEIARKRAHAFIQIGMCFCGTIATDLVEHPQPVLSVAGDRDGLTTYQAYASDTLKIAKVESELTKLNTYFVKPVVIVPGMNHAQCYDGAEQFQDMKAEIGLEQAHREIANVTAAFLSLSLKFEILSMNVKRVNYGEILRAAVDRNRERHLTFAKALENQHLGADQLQVHLAGSGLLAVDKVKVIQHEFVDNFNFSKPYSSLDRLIIQIYMHGVDSKKVLKNMWVKFRSREGLLEEFCRERPDDCDVIRGDSHIATAKEFNEQAFSKALSTVTEEARNKYFRHGRQLRFLDDLQVENKSSWDSSDLSILPVNDNSDLSEVQSPIFKSSRSGGMHFMKLLTVGRAMGWIYQDSFEHYTK